MYHNCLGKSCHKCHLTNYLCLPDSLQLDHDACGNINSMIIPCCGDLKELKGGHYHRIVEITENAGKCLLNEYVVMNSPCVY